MKRQIKKLSLNKKTISNLNSPEMSRVIGGGRTNTSYANACCGGGGGYPQKTKNGNTCYGHNTCQYTCI